MKYKNKKIEVDGRIFDSQKEAQRYLYLREEEKQGLIKDLACQTRFDYKLNGKKIFFYKADFTYVREGKVHVEDVKSAFTEKLPLFRLKKKIIEAIYDLEIEIIK